MISYKEILKNMKQAYFDECGENPDMQGDIGIRFKAVASQLFDVGVAAEYALMQTKLATATGTYLDDIGKECDLTRHISAKASGRLTFFVDSELPNDLLIPKGTICAKTHSKYIQYETIEDVVIPAGRTKCTVSAIATDVGEEYDCISGEIGVIVNPCTGVSGVRNDFSFEGGYLGESDYAFRARIFDFLSAGSNGLNEQYLVSKICNLSNVLSASITKKSDGSCCVYLKTMNKTLNIDTKNEIIDLLSIFSFFDVSVTVKLATERKITTQVNYYGFGQNERIEKLVAEYLQTLGVGQAPSQLDFEKFVAEKTDKPILGLKIRFSIVSLSKSEYVTDGGIEVKTYD